MSERLSLRLLRTIEHNFVKTQTNTAPFVFKKRSNIYNHSWNRWQCKHESDKIRF